MAAGNSEQDAIYKTKLPLKMYQCWLKLFDYCKFTLHNFDQSLKSAWPMPRAPIPKVMHLIKEEMGELVSTYYQMK